jgi:hypothetical protein
MRIGIGIGIPDYEGGAGFQPPQLSGNVLWLRADLGITLDGSNKVSAWADQSGLGHDVSQSTSTKRPPYSSSGGPNNSPFVGTFDGVDDFLRGVWTQPQPLHVFAVAMHSASDATTGKMLDGSIFNTLAIQLNTVADDPRIILGSTEIGGGGATAESTAYHRYEVQSVNPAIFNVDNVLHASGFSGTFGPDGVSIGIGGNSANDPVDCRWCELIYYNRILASSDVARVDSYLKDRYALP